MNHVLSSLNRLPLLSELALVILLAWMVAGWFLPQSNAPVSNNLERIEKTTTALPELSAMLAVKLFGRAPQQAKPVAPVVAQPKPVIKRPLTLKLLGTVVAGKSSAAIIAIRTGVEEQVFFINDTIQPGVILQTVEADAIIVNQGGSLQRISLEQGDKLTSTTIANAIPPAPMRLAPTPPVHKLMDRNQLQRQLQDFPTLLSQARATPHFANGKVNGFSVNDIVRGSLYQQAGLQNGDIILSINGEKITGTQQAMSIYSKLKSSPSLELQLIRAGSLQNIHYDIR
ncbi:MAG: type II secretion system protein N [Mariprofundus sp.]|nr:type II secretion system protein N [Mariprofundus sp.]